MKPINQSALNAPDKRVSKASHLMMPITAYGFLYIKETLTAWNIVLFLP
jgi:hypothetical protein